MNFFFNMALTGLLTLGGLTTATTPSGNTVTIPERAVEVAPNLYFLGEQQDVDGAMVQGYAFVHRKDNAVKNNAAKGKPSNACYGFIARGAKWKTTEGFMVNGTNEDGIAPERIFDLINGGVGKWETAAGKEIIGGGENTQDTLVADMETMDGVNEVYMGQLKPGTIGVTITWGIFGGPTQNRELREWDQVYNTYYDWSAGEQGELHKMDFDNIATHELGHTMGLDDLYTSGCNQETMFGYGIEGETYKRDLNPGDIAGIRTLYQ